MQIPPKLTGRIIVIDDSAPGQERLELYSKSKVEGTEADLVQAYETLASQQGITTKVMDELEATRKRHKWVLGGALAAGFFGMIGSFFFGQTTERAALAELQQRQTLERTVAAENAARSGQHEVFGEFNPSTYLPNEESEPNTLTEEHHRKIREMLSQDGDDFLTKQRFRDMEQDPEPPRLSKAPPPNSDDYAKKFDLYLKGEIAASQKQHPDLVKRLATMERTSEGIALSEGLITSYREGTLVDRLEAARLVVNRRKTGAVYAGMGTRYVSAKGDLVQVNEYFREEAILYGGFDITGESTDLMGRFSSVFNTADGHYLVEISPGFSVLASPEGKILTRPARHIVRGASGLYIGSWGRVHQASGIDAGLLATVAENHWNLKDNPSFPNLSNLAYGNPLVLSGDPLFDDEGAVHFEDAYRDTFFLFGVHGLEQKADGFYFHIKNRSTK